MSGHCTLWSVWLAGVLVVSISSRAEDVRPWAEGVSAEHQEQALALFQEGNGLFEHSQYSAALTQYRKALELWDHPAIRYNAAVALINLDKPLTAYDDLEAALRFGEAPFPVETFRQAQLYRRLIAGQFAELEVSCEEEGAEVTLDGEWLLMGPGQTKRRLVPGRHQLVARKAGLQTVTAVVQLEAGTSRRESIRPLPLPEQEVKWSRRWPVTMPWVVLGGGAALALSGLPLMMASRGGFDRYDSDLSRLCPSGCTTQNIPSSLQATYQQARAENGAAIGLFAAGGAALATGVVLISMNGLRPDNSASAPVVVPWISPNAGGLWASFRWP